jgi:hypothetical protein
MNPLKGREPGKKVPPSALLLALWREYTGYASNGVIGAMSAFLKRKMVDTRV